MEKNKKRDVKETIQGTIIDTILEVGSDTASEILKDSVTGLVGEIAVDAGVSLIPGLSGAISGYKRARFEGNIKVFTSELSTRMDELSRNLETKTSEQKQEIEKLYNFVMDYVIEEQQEAKIEFMVNGFVNITAHEKVTEDFILTFYDMLKELRMVDLSVVKLMYSSRFTIGTEETETFYDVMERHGIDYEQYQSVRRNLLRIGLLNTATDLHVTNDLKEISNTFKALYTYLEKLTNPKNKSSLPKLKMPKIKSKETQQVSKFGREFVEFFMNTDRV